MKHPAPGIRAQLTIVVASLGLVLLTAHVWVDVVAERRRVEHETRDAARAMTGRLARLSAYLLLSGTPLDPVLHEAPQSSNLEAIAVVDSRGIVLSASDSSWRGRPLAQTPLGQAAAGFDSVLTQTGVTLASLPKHRTLGGAPIGDPRLGLRLLVQLDDHARFDDVRRETLFEALWSAIFSAFVLNVLWLLLESRVTRPALQIARAADRLAEGDLSSRSGVGGPDEIRRAGEAFDRMATRIEATETDLARTRALLDAVLRAMPPSVVAVSRADMRVLFANPSAEAMVGRRLEPGEPTARFLDRVEFEHLDGTPCPPEERPIAAVLRSGTAMEFDDLVYISEDGTRIPVHVAAAPVVTGGGGEFDAVVAVTQDRRDVERTLRELRDWEVRFKTVAAATEQIVYDWNVVTGECRSSDSVQAVLGCSAAEFDDSSHSWQTRIHPDDIERVRTEVASCQREHRHLDCEYRLAHADGRWRVIRDRGFFMFDDSGRATRMLGSMSDITAHRDLERQLAHAQKMETVGTLAGGVAHDFNNQLTGVMGHLDLLAHELGPEDSRQEHVRLALHAAERCAELTRGLLAFSRRLTSHPQPTRLNETVNETLALLRRTLPSSVELNAQLEPEAWIAMADAGQIQQVLMNLSVNARDAMPEGGTLSVWTCNASIEDAAARRHPEARTGDFVEIGVADTGSGIPPGVLPRIFEPFFTTKSVGIGTGLGLSMAYGIVSNHGGWIEVSSVVGEGTTFRVLLPRSNEQTSPAPRGLTPARGGKETILVVDDEAVVRELAVRTLAQAGYHVLSACDGLEALRVFHQNREQIRAVLLDLTMPGRSGLEVMGEIHSVSPETRVILSSGFSSEALDGAASARARGATSFLPKPYGARPLLECVRSAIDGAREPAES